MQLLMELQFLEAGMPAYASQPAIDELLGHLTDMLTEVIQVLAPPPFLLGNLPAGCLRTSVPHHQASQVQRTIILHCTLRPCALVVGAMLSWRTWVSRNA